MTSKELLSAWADVESKAALGANGTYLHLQVLGGDLPIGVIVRSQDGRPGLLVRFEAKDLPEMPKPRSGRGFSFERVVQFGPQSYGLPIILGDDSDLDMFSMMGSDLIAVVEQSNGKRPAVELVLNRIALWRQFLQRRGGHMTDDEVHGLFGELQVLGKLLVSIGPDAALDTWHGPDRDLLDFHLQESFIEVKTWRVESGSKVTISNAHQLGIDANRPIYLVAIQLSPGGADAKTLGEQINDLRGRIDGILKQRFDELLAAYGYMDAQADEYPEKISVLSVSSFRVQRGFPFIDSKGLPGGVHDLRYSIELGAMEPFRELQPNLTLA